MPFLIFGRKPLQPLCCSGAEIRMLRLACVLLLLLACGRPGAVQAALSPTDCLAMVAQSVLMSISAQPNNATAAIASTVQSYLTGCLYDLTTEQPLKILAMADPRMFSPVFQLAFQTYQNVSGFKVNATFIPPEDLMPTILAQFTTPGAQQYDGYFVDPSWNPQLMRSGALQALDAYIANDQVVNWTDYAPFLRTAFATYAGSTVLLPIGVDTLQLYYREDIFAELNLTVPNRWDDLLAMAQSLDGRDWDGDGVADYAICLDGAPDCSKSLDVAAIAASYLQYQGPSQGMLVDPANLNPLVNTPAMSEAMRIYVALRGLGSPLEQQGCNDTVASFLAGRCLMSIKGVSQLKTANLLPPPLSVVRGKIGVAPLPGTDTVLDRDSSTMFPCNPQQCPDAVWTLLPDGTYSWVNRAATWSNDFVAGVNPTANSEYQKAAYQFFSFFTYTQVQLLSMLMTVAPGISPVRSTSLSAAFVEALATEGYDSGDAANYVAAHKTTAFASNNVLGLRLPGGTDPVWAAMYAAQERLTAGMSYASAAQQFAADVGSALGGNGFSYDDTLSMYQTALGYIPDSDDTPPFQGTALAAAAVLPISVCLVVSLALWFWKHHRAGSRLLTLTAGLAPHAGSSTTVLAMNIEDIAELRAELPPEVMDQALRLHGGIVRRLLNKHDGYESVNDGTGGAVLAFHVPEQALEFALELQRSLLLVDWPAELLAREECRKMYMAPTQSSKARPDDDKTVHSGGANSLMGSMQRETQSMSAAGSSFASSAMSSWMPSFGSARGDSMAQGGGPSNLSGQSHVSSGTSPLHPLQRSSGSNAAAAAAAVQAGGGVSDSGDPSAAGIAVGGLLAQHVIATAGAVAQLRVHPSHNGPNGQPPTDSFLSTLQHALEKCTYQDRLAKDWAACPESRAGAVLMYRGLRVRMGLHAGMDPNEDEVSLCPVSGKVQYGAAAVSMARTIAEASHGGMILMSESTFTRLPSQATARSYSILHIGEHLVKDRDAVVNVYYAEDESLRCRTTAFKPVRTVQLLTLGVPQAPVGCVTIVFMYVVGASSLLAWNQHLAAEALHRFHFTAKHTLARRGGYMVECVDGLFLASFVNPWDALTWALRCHQRMLMAAWPEELLKHELCEQIAVTQQNNEDPTAEQQEVVLFRGLRLKTGMDVGHTKAEVNATTGRLAYRGRVMNRASRIAGAASTGQVLCSHEVWVQSADSTTAQRYGVGASSLGFVELKGVAERIELFCCRSAHKVVASRRSSSICFPVEGGGSRRALMSAGDRQSSLGKRHSTSEAGSAFDDAMHGGGGGTGGGGGATGERGPDNPAPSSSGARHAATSSSTLASLGHLGPLLPGLGLSGRSSSGGGSGGGAMQPPHAPSKSDLSSSVRRSLDKNSHLETIAESEAPTRSVTRSLTHDDGSFSIKSWPQLTPLQLAMTASADGDRSYRGKRTESSAGRSDHATAATTATPGIGATAKSEGHSATAAEQQHAPQNGATAVVRASPSIGHGESTDLGISEAASTDVCVSEAADPAAQKLHSKRPQEGSN